MTSKWTIEVRQQFSAAHQLPDSDSLYTKACHRKHGHGYHVRVKLSSHELKDGMVVDFGRVKAVIDKLDHRDLNEILDVPTTAENIAEWLFFEISSAIYDPKIDNIIGKKRVWVDEVKLCETFKGEELTSWVTYGQE